MSLVLNVLCKCFINKTHKNTIYGNSDTITKVLECNSETSELFPSDGELFWDPLSGAEPRPKQCWPAVTVNGASPVSQAYSSVGLVFHLSRSARAEDT